MKRYNWGHRGMDARPCGQYVRFADYADLQARLATALAAESRAILRAEAAEAKLARQEATRATAKKAKADREADRE